MTINILSIIYVLGALILFYLIRKDLRIPVLSITSLIYVAIKGKNVVISLIILSILVYALAILIEELNNKDKNKGAKLISYFGIFMMAGSLLIFKCIGPIVDNEYISGAFRIGENSILYTIIIPIGFSFYCFQGISYLVDVYKKKCGAEHNIFKFLIYMCWFPKFISGPIERADIFFERISGISEVKFFDEERLKKSVSYIVIGLFYKLMVADRISTGVSAIFGAPEEYGGIILLLGILLYSIQIYCDFAGYSMVAIGISSLFGIELTENFAAPYYSKSIGEFWSRWHISLSSWLRDYIYIPLGGNRKGKRRKVLNLLIVFLISGVWHGAGAGYIIWGLLHGVYLAIESNINKKHMEVKSYVARILVFIQVSFAWFFFRATSLSRIGRYIVALLHNKFFEFKDIKLGIFDFVLLIISMTAIILFDRLIYKNMLSDKIKNTSIAKWGVVIYILLVLIIVFGAYGGGYSSNLIYMQF